MTYNIISSGSSGNCTIISDSIMIDIGVAWNKISQYAKDIKLVLLTHSHGDHFKPSTVRRLHQERPSVRWGGCEWMVPKLIECGVDKRVIDVGNTDMDSWNLYSNIYTHPVPLVHDVPNCGWIISLNNGKETLFYATDTGTLEHIEYKNCDYYFIEANHTLAEIESRIEDKKLREEFAYETRAMRNHLSEEQAMDWLAKNMGPNSKVVFLHKHKDK